MNLSDLVTHHSKNNPNRAAFIFRGSEISYKQLEEKINQIAIGLNQLGIKKGSTFGLVLKNSPEFVILVMALSKLGAVAVPINFLEKPDRIALILNDAKAEGVLTAKEFYRSVTTACEQVKSVKNIYLREESYKSAKAFSDLQSDANSIEYPKVNPDDLVLLLYTSGTTGNPKGVMLTHKNLLSNMEQCLKAISLSENDRFLCLLPMFHSFAWTTCVLIPLKLGALCVINESLLPFDPVIKSIWKYKITLFVAVPQIYSALTAKIKGVKAFILKFLNPIRLCISGAAPLLPAVHSQFEKTFSIPLLEGYGLTETSPVVALNPEKKRKVGTVGLPLPGVQVELRDDDEKVVSSGEVGEIWIQGDNVMSGYYNKPNESQEVLTKDSWLKSGDMGKFDNDGYLAIVDRKKDLIIVKGLNVYPQEVENVISQHQNIKEVAVVGKPDPETGEEMIRAFVVLNNPDAFDRSGIFGLCRKNLAPYKRPKDIIVLEEMPKNALQKILKKDLRNR